MSFVRHNFAIILLLLLFILFHRYWEDLIGNYIIDTFFRYFESDFLNDTIFLVALLGSIWFATSLLGKKINQKKMLICILAIAFWVYYRWVNKQCGFEHNPYYIDFKPLFNDEFYQIPGIIEKLMYIDIIPFFALCIIVPSIITSVFSKVHLNFIDNILSLSGSYINRRIYTNNDNIDNPIKYETEDILMRCDFAKSTIDKLLELDSRNGAFTFGIDSPWGSGKTSFMNLMKEYILSIHNAKDVTIIDFNPWIYIAEKDLVTAFFDELSKHLEHYDYSLSKDIIDYSKLLSAFETRETKLIASLINLTNITKKSTTLETKKRKITDALKQIQIPIFVFIDDLDRLGADELMEMMKLIRNISNFPYIYFIAAYDRAYMIECLEKQMKTRGTDFVEKIFQYEFHLPPCPKEKLRRVLYRLIVKSDVFKGSYIDIKALNECLNNDSDNPLDSLSNLREIKRLANHFIASYRYVKDEVNVVDLLLIELIKTKYPLVFSFFERKKDAILIPSSDTKHYELYTGGNDVNRIDIINYLQNNRKEFKISHLDRLIIEKVFMSLFPTLIQTSNDKRINEIEWFNRYINLTELETDISIKEFEDCFEANITVLIRRIDQWLDHHKSISLRYRILNHETHSHKDQQKLIQAAFYFMSKGKVIENYSIDKLLKTLLAHNENRSDADSAKEFISNLVLNYYFSSEIRKYTSHLYNLTEELHSIALTKKDIATIQQKIFDKVVQNNSQDVHIVFECFCELITGFSYYDSKDIIKYRRKKELIQLMKNYAEGHIKDFISEIIDCVEYVIYFDKSGKGIRKKKFVLNNVIELIWGKWGNFFNFIDKQDDNDLTIKEFKAFIELYKKRKFRKTEFIFHHSKHSSRI